MPAELVHYIRCEFSPLRFLLASQSQAMGKVLAIVNRAISTYLINKAGFKFQKHIQVR